MDMALTPRPIGGKIKAIASKSDAHRALICAALSDRPTMIATDSVLSKDMQATKDVLESMGACIAAVPGGLMVHPIGLVSDKPVVLDCKESGSTLRFLVPVAAALGLKARFIGQGRLGSRPMKELLDALASHGVSIRGDGLPFEICGKLRTGIYSIRGDVSSQYISGLLLALSIVEGESEIELLSPMESSGYVDMTLKSLRDFGADIVQTQSGWKISGKKLVAPTQYTVEGDWSNAAFWLCAGALNHTISVSGLRLDSLQKDKEITAIVQQFGADTKLCVEGVTVAANRKIPFETDAREIPDLVPILAVLGCGCVGISRIRNCARLRLKESDRIASVCAMINALGGDAFCEKDDIIINGSGSLTGGTVDSQNDHRIVMAAAIASTICKSAVTIKNAEAVEKSYPAFFDDFAKLGGKVDVI